jgi:hypothetical protein
MLFRAFTTVFSYLWVMFQGLPAFGLGLVVGFFLKRIFPKCPIWVIVLGPLLWEVYT